MRGSWWRGAAVVVLLGLAACAGSKREDKLLTELADLDKQTIYDRAEALYADKKLSQARDLFSFLYDTFPNDPLGHKAALRVADTYAARSDSASQTEARLRYRDFANRYPNDPDRPYALLRLGQTFGSAKLRSDRDPAPLKEALDAYQQLISLYPTSVHVDEARQHAAELRQLLADHEWQVARFYLRNRRWRGAMWRLERLQQDYPDYAGMSQVEGALAQARAEVERIDALLGAEPTATPDPAPTDQPPAESQGALTGGDGVE